MLQLVDIKKEYGSGNDDGSKVQALKGVNINFRENEFVSILGPSGCGKTTLLNIIGGLDQYTSGDLIINGVSTVLYKDRDWDTYRNHSIGFVFQSYNLIPHQTVLANVELALTLSGVSKSERRKRAVEALQKVGLGDQLKKKPNQMSGGQMQRVAIARALVNNPDILLADEPTGALDTKTSIQIMELLKEVAKDRLVIMVTHNPDLAEQYSTRIVSLLDGLVTGDTNPMSEEELAEAQKNQSGEKPQRKTSMGFLTAISLSLNNLMTKKARTFLTAFAGSIGIIGISLILSLSNGVQLYINRVQEDTLSSTPLTITTEAMNFASMMTSLSESMNSSEAAEHVENMIYSNDTMGKLVNSWMKGMTSNNLKKFKEFLDTDEGIQKYVSDVQYSYDVTLNIYTYDADGDVVRVNPSPVFEKMFNADTLADAMKKIDEEGGEINENMSAGFSMMGGSSSSSMGISMGGGSNVWNEMLDDRELLESQYDVIAGRWPESYNELVVVVDDRNRISDFTLYALGLRDQDELSDATYKLLSGADVTSEEMSFTYDEILGLEYYLLYGTDYYAYDEENGVWVDKIKDEKHIEEVVSKATKLKVVGILRPNEDAVSGSLGTSVIGYPSNLITYAAEGINNSDIVKQQKEKDTVDIFTGLPFVTDELKNVSDDKKAENFKNFVLKDAELREKADIYLDYVSAPNPQEVEDKTQEQLASLMGDGSPEATVAAIGTLAQMYPDKTLDMGNGTEMTLAQLAGYLQMQPEALSQGGSDPAAMTKMFHDMIYEEVEKEMTEAIKNASTEMTTTELAEGIENFVDKYATKEQLVEMYDKYMPEQYSETTLDENLSKLKTVDLDTPESINIYCKTFEDKDQISELIKKYNDAAAEDDKIVYTDITALLMSGVSTIINAISYILIAFVAISLVVSSIMIGIITYISVLERTKEIGILRAIGASKRDVSHVFNAETLLIGLTSGLIGIGVTLILLIPANIIITSLTDISNLAKLPWQGGIILVLISMFLTIVAGIFPSMIAAKKDPVVALRTE